MAAIGQSGTDTDIRNTLGVSIFDGFPLVTSDEVIMWNRYKPVRAAGFPTDDKRWKGDAGNCGLNLPVLQTDNTYIPTNWEYLKPRGSSAPEGVDEPARMDDFRGYTQDATLKPPIYSYMGGASSGNNVPSTIYPTVTEPEE